MSDKIYGKIRLKSVYKLISAIDKINLMFCNIYLKTNFSMASAAPSLSTVSVI